MGTLGGPAGLDSSMGGTGSICTDHSMQSDLSSSLTSAARRGGGGSSLAQYELEGKLGTGKFSTVWRARHVPSGKRVALKTVQIFEIVDPKQRADCIREVNMLQSLENSNIVRYLDSFIEDNELVIVLDWAEGGDLGKVLKDRQAAGHFFQEQEVLAIFSQVCAAVHHMHERRIMHRDLKPSNILISNEGVKVGDMGLSRYFSSRTAEAHSVVGTPYYMSPQCIKGLPYDWGSDVWSLGCLLYELITLRSPFYEQGLNYYSLGKRITSCDFPPLPATVSRNLRLMVYAMLNVHPECRPKVAILGRAAIAASQGVDLFQWTDTNRLLVPHKLSKYLLGLTQERQRELAQAGRA